MPSTKIAEQFEAKGLTAQLIEIRTMLAKWHNNGVSKETLQRELDAAYELGSEAGEHLPKGQPSRASASQPNDGEKGQTCVADKAMHCVPASPSPHAAKGHPRRAERASEHLPDAAPKRGEGLWHAAAKAKEAVPVSAPSQSFIDARKRVMQQKAAVLTIMDSFKVRDGRGIGHVKRGELRTMEGETGHEYHVLKLTREYIDRFRPASSMLTDVAGLVPIKDMERIVQQAAEMSDVQ